MKPIVSICFVLFLFTVSCISKPPVEIIAPPQSTMLFDDGIKALGKHLKEQIQVHLSQERKLFDFKGNPPQTVAIDPFIEYESGNVLNINDQIPALFQQGMGDTFHVQGFIDPDTLSQADYIIAGILKLDDLKKEQKIFITIIDPKQGTVIGGSHVSIAKIDTHPLAIYQESPIFLKGKEYNEYIKTAQQLSDTKIEDYTDNLKIRALVSKGNKLYQEKDYRGALTYFTLAMNESETPSLSAINMAFTVQIKLQHYERAEKTFFQLIERAIVETGQFNNKFLFPVNSSQPLDTPELSRLYGIYIRQIAAYVAEFPTCNLKIVGHSSRSGTERYNLTLSGQRAQWIKKAIIKEKPDISKRIEAEGKGYSENIVGSGADDFTDQIDRRVEFFFINCQ